MYKNGKLLKICRFDLESFDYNIQSKQCLLYPEDSKLFDQTVIFKKIVDLLDSHNAKGAFSISYDILINHPEMLQPLIDSPGGHEFTYHIHPKWDKQLEKDFGSPLKSSFLSYYNKDELIRLFELAERAFHKVFGYKPLISFTGNAVINTGIMNLLEERGYTVQGDYMPNADYRLYKNIITTDNFSGRDGFAQGHGAPLYPYAPNSAYTPNRYEGMLLGDMEILEIPTSQIKTGEGLVCDTLFNDPESTIKAIDGVYKKRQGISTFLTMTHLCFGAIIGPDKNDINNDYLNNMNRVLNHIDNLEEAEFSTCADAKKAYREWEKKANTESYKILDCINGILYYDKVQSLKFNAIGATGNIPHVTIAQDNGIAEWLIEGKKAGPIAADKKEWEIIRRSSILSADMMVENCQQNLYSKNLEYIYKKHADSIEIICNDDLINNIYTIANNMITITSDTDEKCLLIHRINLHPDFDNITINNDGNILINDKKANRNFLVKTNADTLLTLKETTYTGLRLYFNIAGLPIHTGTHLKKITGGEYKTELHYMES